MAGLLLLRARYLLILGHNRSYWIGGVDRLKVVIVANHLPPHNLRVFYPAYNDSARDPSLTNDQFLEAVIARNIAVGIIPEGAKLHIIDDSEIPPDHVLDSHYMETIYQ